MGLWTWHRAGVAAKHAKAAHKLTRARDRRERAASHRAAAQAAAARRRPVAAPVAPVPTRPDRGAA